MSESKSKCLYCQEALEGVGDYHPQCSRKFFGKSVAPSLEHGLDEMEKLAGEVGRPTLVGLWGDYILKPPTSKYPGLPEVEATTMHLAEETGLKVVPYSLIRLKSGELAYVTRRIDRSKHGKIAMEDLCQLTERLTEDKYKGSLEQVGKTIRKFSSQPGLDAVDFFERVLFCFLTGNADMHLKNFSLWIPTRDRVQLAPACDLVATSLLVPEDEEESALALNGKKKNLRRKDFDALAGSLELSEKVVENIYQKMAKSIDRWDPILERSFLSEPMNKDYARLIRQRAEVLF
jgi:serine/threonine-protein kinase HipA